MRSRLSANKVEELYFDWVESGRIYKFEHCPTLKSELTVHQLAYMLCHCFARDFDGCRRIVYALATAVARYNLM